LWLKIGIKGYKTFIVVLKLFAVDTFKLFYALGKCCITHNMKDCR